ncbi:MAG TPA: hypothetical protein VM689_01465 [Aliidongia sp.]|nr:hypothetical protein [Aliidongia sp.]
MTSIEQGRPDDARTVRARYTADIGIARPSGDGKKEPLDMPGRENDQHPEE